MKKETYAEVWIELGRAIKKYFSIMVTEVRAWIAKVTWWIFIWAIQMTKEEYWDRIHYEIEKKRKFDATAKVKPFRIPDWPIKK